MVHAVVRSMALRKRLRSRMWYRHDLDTADIWSEKVRVLSKMTTRLQAESTGERMTSIGTWIVGWFSFSSCFGRPMTRNSVFEGLRERQLDDIHFKTIDTVSSRWAILCEKSTAKIIYRVECHQHRVYDLKMNQIWLYWEEKYIEWIVENQEQILEEHHIRVGKKMI